MIVQRRGFQLWVTPRPRKSCPGALRTVSVYNLPGSCRVWLFSTSKLSLLAELYGERMYGEYKEAVDSSHEASRCQTIRS